jgi:hypothetical protein
MKTIDDIATAAHLAISSNWSFRNRAISNIPATNARVVQQRKHQLREWVTVLRIVRDERNHEHVTRMAIRNKDGRIGPLMGHDLRNRVILAGLDAQIERARQQPMACAA